MNELNLTAMKTYELKKRYWLLSSIPNSLRKIITILLLLLGFAIQLKASIFFGGIFIFAASLLNLLKGINIKKPETKETVWERATFSEFSKILEKINQIKKWSSLSVQYKIMILFIYSFFAFPFLWGIFYSNDTFFILFIDFNLLFIPLFLTGNRSIWNPPDLKIKIETLFDCLQHKDIKGNTDIKVQPYLLIGRLDDKLNFPLDAKLMIEFIKAPKDFLGIQIQANVNTIGSNKYPYVYAVLIAKNELGLCMKNNKSGKIIFEYEKQDDMDILVIRQFTTKTSGYHTDKNTINEIIEEAFLLTKNLLKEAGI